MVRQFVCLSALLLSFASLSFSQTKGVPTSASGIGRFVFSRGDFVYLQNADGKAPQQLAQGMDPSLSPSGKMVAFTVNAKGPQDPDRTIRIMDLQTKKTTDFKSLAPHISYLPMWSPDETRIAFNLFLDSRWHVAVIDVAKGEWTSVTKDLPGKTDAFLSSWAPEGKTILCQDLATIYEVGADGSIANQWKVEKIAGENGITSSTRFLFSPDRRYLLFDAAEAPDVGYILLYDLQPGTLRRLTGKTLEASQPIWLGGSNEFLFANYRKLSRNKGVFDIYRSTLTAGKPVLVVQNASNVSVAAK